MYFFKTLKFAIIYSLMTGLTACTKDDNKVISIEDFSTATLKPYVQPFNVESALLADDDDYALQLKFSTQHGVSGVKLKPEQPWDLSGLTRSALVFEAANNHQEPIMLSVNVTGKNGLTQRRTIGIAAGEQGHFFFELKGEFLDVDTGLRDTPAAFAIDARKMIIRGAKMNVDFSQVSEIQLYTETQIRNTQIVLDNIRFAQTPPSDPNFLVGIVDQFGQRADVDFDIKVSSEHQMALAAKQELAALQQSIANKSANWPARSTFGGWLQGPKLQATGYFRTEKHQGKWWLVDPEGYLYISTGIANARMSNTSTFTGVDYRDNSVRYIDPNDVTPEDSQGIGGEYAEAQKTAFIANEQRHKAFNWLPSYDHELAEHYGYRRKAHLGPFAHGEVFSFYQANLERRYGQSYPGSYIDTWRDVTLARMQDWGFTSFGNWTDAMFYQNNQIPYFANGWIIGDFKTLSSGFDYWGAMPDPFDPEFVKRADITTQVIAKEVQNNPWCVGVFIDNEMSWGGAGQPIRRYGIVIDALSREVVASPTKAHFVTLLKEKYTDITALNRAWQTAIADWQTLAAGVNFKAATSYSPTMLADFSWLLEVYADEYFKVVRNAVKRYLPNHLYMGARFTTWGTSPEAHLAAKKYADVVSYNYYREGLDPMTWDFLAALDKPSLIGEFHFGTTATGHPNPGIIHAPDQQTRADMFRNYMNTVLENPYMVGAHWFQYIDSPVTGRAHDGENYNVGFVTTADMPYPRLVEAAKMFHKGMYQRRYEHNNKQ